MNRCNEVACNLHKMEKALRGTYLDIRSSNESTIHPAKGLLIQALQFSDNTDLVQSVHHINDHCSHILYCWVSKLKKDAETICPGEKGGKYIFLLNNIYDVLRMMRRPGVTFASEEMVSRLSSLIQPYKKSYFAERWVPLKNILHLNLDEFTAEFIAICENQRTWKVTAELRYDLREEIVDLIVPPYEAALQANQSRLSGVLRSLERLIAGKKKQKRYTGEELKKEIRALL